jgi:p-hydroxybenzoate 3-monooxygenase
VRTQVGIIGAGPAGLTLAHVLQREGIDAVVLESRSRAYVEARIRAGVIEQGAVDVLVGSGAGERLQSEGLVHEGIELQFGGERHRIDFRGLTGKAIVVYGQTELVQDLIELRLAAGLPLLFEAEALAIEDVESEQPRIRFRRDGAEQELECDVVAGCDGFHGISRPTIPAALRHEASRDYEAGWLGILADVAPSNDELIYSHHERGFALLSMRSPELSRLYVQVRADEEVAEWSDARVWEELQLRLGYPGWTLAEGAVLEKSITPMRSYVCSPMQHGRLFLAGDAAHIVPPTGAKGLNLALNDVRLLFEALVGWFERSDGSGLETYSERCLRRVWRAEHFSWWMTSMLHRLPGQDAFDLELQLSQLRYVCSSQAAATSLAENYVGYEPGG